MATIASSVTLSGCLVDGDKSNSVSTSNQQDAPRISVTDQQTPRAEILGIVQDTNGRPVANARVSIGSQSTTTDANGTYSIAGVAVTGFSGNAGADEADPVQVSIVPAADDGFVSATVSVAPKASTIIQTAAGDHTNTDDSLLAIITTDGLAVSAGITVVPALQATVTGYLRDQRTGEAIANTVVGLDMVGVNNVNQQQQQNGDSKTSYGADSFRAATDADGRFTFEKLPNDSEFTLSVANWSVEEIRGGIIGNPRLANASLDTTPEVVDQNIGTVDVLPVVSVDNVAPFVTSVTGVVINAAEGVLNDDLNGTQGLKINFSETLKNIIDDNSVYVFNVTENRAIATSSIALSNDGKSLTVTTQEAIGENQEFDIYLNTVDFLDPSDNRLVVSTQPFNDKETPEYDENVSLTNTGAIRLNLRTYADPVTAAGAVKNLAQVQTDGLTSQFDLLQQLNSTFADADSGTVLSGDTDIMQLNAAEAGRLTALANAAYADAGLNSAKPGSVATDVARIRFTLDSDTPARNYLITAANTLAGKKVINILNDSGKLAGSLTNNNSDAVTLVVDADYSGELELLVEGVAAGDTLSIASLTSFGVIDQSATLLLEDDIAPTTVLQNSYGNGRATNAVVGTSYGNGGELADAATSALGAPFINITPRLLVPQAGQAVPLPIDSIWDALQAGMDKDDNGDNQVDAGDIAAYDAAAYSSWTNNSQNPDVRERRIGIAFSENIELVTGQNPAYNGSVSLTDWTEQNDVMLNDQNNGIQSADLVNVKVSDVLALANDDHGKVIDFTNAVMDASANTASNDNNAKVVVRDLMPPMMTSAVYRGDDIVLTFNENIVINDGDVINLAQPGNATGLAISINANNAAVNNNVLTINRDAWGDLDSESYFSFATYDHDNNNTTEDAAHGVILARETEDSRGTSWDNWDENNAALVDIPAMVIRDDAGDFRVGTPSVSNFTGGSSNFTVIYRFSHRINLVDSGLSSGATDNQMSGAEVASAFTLTSGASIDTGLSSAQLDNSGRVLTVNVRLVGSLFSDDEFELANGRSISSEWDANDAAITNLSTLTVQ